MKETWGNRSRKWLLSSVSVILLAGHLSPLAVFAEEEVDDSGDAVHSIVEEVEEAEPVVVQEFDTVKEFVHNFNSLSEDEIIYHVTKFRLFADDEQVVRSKDEVIQEEILTIDTSEFTELAHYLNKLVEENNRAIDNNELEVNSDLDENALEEQLGEQLKELEETEDSGEMQTFSMARSAQLSVNRIEGSNRYKTAVAISKSGWNTANTVIVVDANQFADSLAGAPLAHALNAPVLLSGSSGGNTDTLNEIKRLKAKKVIILGGESAVSKAYENQIKNSGLTVERLAGSNRYETAKVIADRVISLTGSKEAFLVSGTDFADAMSVAPFASQKGAPIYLTKKTSLASQVKTATQTIKNWTIIGGFSAVDGNVGGQLKDAVTKYSRISGLDRYETNRKVINAYGNKTSKAFVATGHSYVDALTGSVLAAKEGTSVILVKDHEQTIIDTIDFVQARGLSQLSLFGGLTVLNKTVADSLQNLDLVRKKPLIYIDPGHGGTDSGAYYGGVREKNLNLPTANYLKNALERTGKYTVVMSRESDRSLTLADRSSHANELRADILVSVHYNAMGTGLARGIETFIYHPTYTSNRAHFNVKDERIKESLRLADAVHAPVISATGMPNRGVRGSNLHMVRVPDMPAIIIELGFLDNYTDRNIVTKSSYQQKAAEAMQRGIDAYFGN